MAVAEKLKLCSATRKWDKMSREERAVALAKDVLAIIGAKRVKVDTGSYIRMADVKGNVKDDAKKVLSRQRDCEVCAKGALLFAKITARNNATLRDIGGRQYNKVVEISPGSEECVDAVSDAFDADTCHRIEAAFEGCFHWATNDEGGSFKGAVGWQKKYVSPRSRLIAIMKRVIKNNGSFTMADVENP